MSGYIPAQSIPGSTVGKKKKPKGNAGNSIWDQINGIAQGLEGGMDKNFTGGIAEALEKQAANQKAQVLQKMGVGSAAPNPYDLLQSQLFDAVNSINVAPTPLEQLRQMATQQVSAQYDPQIKALAGQITSTSGKAKRDQGTARDMYGALAKDYLSQLPEMTQQFAAEDQATNQRYDQAQSQMQGEYDEQAANQAAVLKRLGIQAAAQDASQQGMEDQAYFQNQSNMDQQQALSALDQQQNSQLDYQRNLGNTSKIAGENMAQDIGQQLRDYMIQANGQMTGLESGKASAIQALLAQMQQQDSQNVAQQRQQEFDNQMKLYNFELSAQKAMPQTSADETGFGAKGTLTSGLPGAQNYLASIYPEQPQRASNLMELLNNVLSDKEVTQGKFMLDPGDPSMGKSPKYSDVGQQYMEDLLRRQFEQQGQRYNTGDINATMAALEAYLGKLR